MSRQRGQKLLTRHSGGANDRYFFLFHFFISSKNIGLKEGKE
jgi:hypothetical protein